MDMPKLAGTELTQDLYRRLCGRFVGEYVNQVILIHTVDSNGWPHPAILSYFEVLAADLHNIRLATWKTSTTTENMRRNGKVTLSVFDDHVTCYIKGAASEVRSEMESSPHNSKLNVVVEQVLVDQSDPVLEPGAYVASGILWVTPDIAAARSRGALILKELME
jgi:hypothetical protein